MSQNEDFEAFDFDPDQYPRKRRSPIWAWILSILALVACCTIITPITIWQIETTNKVRMTTTAVARQPSITPVNTQTSTPTMTQTATSSATSSATPTITPTALPTRKRATPAPTPIATNTSDCAIPSGIIPGTIQMENFDCGGQNVAYYDTSPDSNFLNTVRNDEGVDIRDKNSILSVLVDTNEWLEYSVYVDSVDLYDFTINYASIGAKNIRLSVDGIVIGTERLESSNSFDNFASHTISSIVLAAGEHTVRIDFLSNNAFFDSMVWTVSSSGKTVDINSCTTTGIEAEDASISGSFVMARDSNASGGQYVHVPNGDGGGSGPSTDSVTFNVNLDAAAAGTYQFRGYVYGASGADDSFWVDIDGSPSDGYLWDIDQNTDYDSELVGDQDRDRDRDDPITVSFASGAHSIRISNREDGTRLDRLELICTGSLATSTSTPISTNFENP